MAPFTSPISTIFSRLEPTASVAAGGLLGSAARTGLSMAVPTDPGEFPVEVLIVNLVGCFLLGWFLARREHTVAGPRSIRFWAIGFLGSLTTFSAFSLDVLDLVGAGRPLAALGYCLISIAGGLGLAFLGLRVGEGAT